jgi:hypothetical protein
MMLRGHLRVAFFLSISRQKAGKKKRNELINCGYAYVDIKVKKGKRAGSLIKNWRVTFQL